MQVVAFAAWPQQRDSYMHIMYEAAVRLSVDILDMSRVLDSLAVYTSPKEGTCSCYIGYQCAVDLSTANSGGVPNLL